ncbi:anti-sigma factor family protein [Rhodanobacter ginsengiterrae]|uniref:anti-sigma factor family protein n=1 Tax=Rhodanobacter ginsengiterrae TaxID=2008451 RepID=UPI003CEF278F
MNPIDDDTLQAYVDGELDTSDAARIEAALAHDEMLARRVRQARDLRAQVRAAFDPILDEPVPARLSALLQPPSPRAATPLGPRLLPAGGHGPGTTRHRATRRWFVPGAALAASVALLAVGLWWSRPGDMVRMQGGQPFAAGALAHALDEALASEPDVHAPVAIGLSFRATDGRICRSFVLRSPPIQAGLACHGDAGWSLPVLGAAVPSEGGELRQAASALSPAVQAAVDARLRGEVFNAQQERAARDAGWRQVREVSAHAPVQP